MRRLLAPSLIASLVLLAGSASPASANTLTPTSADFGAQATGTKSAPKAFTLTADTGNVAATPQAFGNGNWDVSSHNCPNPLTVPNSCTINVVFEPLFAGPLTGTLASVAAIPSGSPNSPTAALKGVGTFSGGKKKKKCKKKKKRSAAAAKKCKKKK